MENLNKLSLTDLQKELGLSNEQASTVVSLLKCVSSSEITYSREFLIKLLTAKKQAMQENHLPINLPSFHNLPLPSRCFKQLTDYQFEIMNRSKERLAPKSSRLILCMPTGTGKTRTSMELVLYFINNHPGGVVWMVDGPELMIQAYQCFTEIFSFLGKKKCSILMEGFGYDGLKMINSLKADSENSFFLILGLQTGRAKLEKLKSIASNVSLVVFDEVHHAIAKTYLEVTKVFLSIQYSCRLLGLSATPFRSSSEEDQKLKELFNNCIEKLQIQNSGKSLFNTLLERSILATPIYKEVTSENERALDSIGLLLKALIKEKDNYTKCLFFSKNIEESKIISLSLNYLGLSSYHLDGNTPYAERENAIRKFSSGDIKVLCNFGILTTGFDCPKIDCIVMSRETSSKVLINQMIGRGLRGRLLGGTNSCLVIVPSKKIDNFVFNTEFLEELFRSWDE